MLAKMWKKFLLAVCIIACIANVMHKLINRHSLEDNLNKANDGKTVFLFNNKAEKKASSSTITTNVVSSNTNDLESAEHNTLQNESAGKADSQNNSTENKSTGTKYQTFNFNFLFPNT